MPTLGDLAQRLYDTFAATQELLKPEPARFQPTRWEELPEWRQEVWVTVAAEAVKAGAEIQQAAVRQAYGRDDEMLLNDPDLQTSLGQMQRGEGRVLDVDDDEGNDSNLWTRFRRDCE